MASYVIIAATSRSYKSHCDPVSALNSGELYKNCRFAEEGRNSVTDLIKNDFFQLEMTEDDQCHFNTIARSVKVFGLEYLPASSRRNFYAWSINCEALHNCCSGKPGG